MKIFSSEQIRNIDEYTISHEGIASSDLMERASAELFRWIRGRADITGRMVVFAGPGNNGGDGLALVRMLASARYNVEAYYVSFTEKKSPDWELNRNRLANETSVILEEIKTLSQFPFIHKDDIIIDAIFGSGLTRPVEGLPAEVIAQINDTDATVISVDIPSGLFGEDNSINNLAAVIEADYTLAFQFPKLAFMFAENSRYVGEWSVLSIGLSDEKIRNTLSPYCYFENSDVKPLLRKRHRFDHKGKFGHSFLVSGSYGKMGAALLAAGAALRTGTGLITCHIPSCGYSVLQTWLPEAMVITDKCDNHISKTGSTDIYSAVGAGPGMGTNDQSQKAIHQLLLECKKPIVLDADALNILSLNKEWLSVLPVNTILTPHPKEFERLAGKTGNDYERLMLQIQFAMHNKCIVILKGACTSIAFPDGRVWFNSSGNQGMATAGSGDVLTGIILSLLAQGYSPEDASVLGVYLHGLAGDIAAANSCFESLIASDIVLCIGKAYNTIRDQ